MSETPSWTWHVCMTEYKKNVQPLQGNRKGKPEWGVALEMSKEIMSKWNTNIPVGAGNGGIYTCLSRFKISWRPKVGIVVRRWLDATIYDSSIELFDKLGWLPIDDIVHVRKLFMLHKISQGHCPEYFSSYFKYVRSIYSHRTRSATCNDVLTPSCKRNSGLRTFHSSACRLWNNLGNTNRNMISHSNFRITLQNDFIKENSSLVRVF